MVAALFLDLLVLVARSYLMGSSYVRLVTVLVSETSKKKEVIFDFKNRIPLSNSLKIFEKFINCPTACGQTSHHGVSLNHVNRGG